MASEVGKFGETPKKPGLAQYRHLEPEGKKNLLSPSPAQPGLAQPSLATPGLTTPGTTQPRPWPGLGAAS